MRPFGALVFGRLGDLVGRKYTFLVTIVFMGVVDLPGRPAAELRDGRRSRPGAADPLRLLQGLALGGEYGGAATYVAEHAPQGRRGYYTTWIQTTATVGLFLSLIVVLDLRLRMTPRSSPTGAGACRSCSRSSCWLCRSGSGCSSRSRPLFQQIKAEGKHSKTPLSEAFGRWENASSCSSRCSARTAGQAVVWYTGQFYALFFLTQTLKLDARTANIADRAARC